MDLITKHRQAKPATFVSGGRKDDSHEIAHYSSCESVRNYPLSQRLEGYFWKSATRIVKQYFEVVDSTSLAMHTSQESKRLLSCKNKVWGLLG
jgi:hypothetical protein